MDVVARWPGSVHDTTIFNDSHIRARFENNDFAPFCLVGDGGYPCRTYLLTPISDPQTLPHQRYNTSQIRTRNPVERLFGVWKRRFPCLSLGLRLSPEKVCEIIVSSAVLHNICCEMNDGVDGFMEAPDELAIMEIIPVYNRGNQNTATRDALVTNIFSNYR